ncbi:hypothetical protein FOA52_007027 [Chlamydomonas sp. UWO 241]|nr:hypothetical protein FOA52_007027 [Chlamydomonas sp. UWO 241]
MELELFRHDLIQTSSSAKGTLVVMPEGEERKTQKVCAGDLTGVVQCFSVRKGEIGMAFKTLPTPDKITSVALGRGHNQRDRIFVAAGSQIRGVSKKGKEFFRFNTQLTEAITQVDVADLAIWSSAEYVHNMYIEGRDKAFYLCPDRINAATVLPLRSATELLPALACQDRHVRILTGSDIALDIPTPAPPQSLLYTLESHDSRRLFPDAKQLLYSTDGGQLVQLLVDGDAGRQGWTLPNPKKLGAIKAIYAGVDFTKTGVSDICIGREDGLLEIYDADETGTLTQVFSAKLNESINALDGGFITGTAVQEVVLQTFSGKVLAYAPPGGGITVQAMDRSGRPVVASEEEERRAGYAAQVTRLRAEIGELGGQLEGERSKFSKGMGSNALLAASAPFTVQDKCKLEPDEACYTLTIESSMPIFTVAIQSSIALQLLDVPSNVAIMSRSPPDEPNGNLTLATYRCQDATSRISVKFKVREGKPGTLTAFIIPNVSPKTAVSVTHRIKGLCLHTPVSEVDAERPTNEMVVTGTFDQSDMHSWLSRLLNDVPQSAASAESGSAMLHYQNALLGTQLTCRYSAGEARFNCDLITTLGHMHEHLMKEATAAKHRVNVSFSPNAASLRHSVAKVWPQLEKQRNLRRSFLLLGGLEELRCQDADVSYLSPEHRQILGRAEEIKKAYQEQPQHLDHLVQLIRDLYLDYCKMTGINTFKARMPALDQMLNSAKSTQAEVLELMLGPTA